MGAGKWEEGELIEREMGRRILKCSGKTTTAAVLGELGWWRLRTRREFIKLVYWIGILMMDESRLVKAVYKHSKHLYTTSLATRNVASNWTKTIHQLVIRYDLL